MSDHEQAHLLQLAADLEHELDNLQHLVEEAGRCMRDLAARPPTYLEVRGAGDIVHDFYCAAERFVERVAVELNGGVPRGNDFHVQMLSRAARPVPGLRPAILQETTCATLREYLRFRHLFRHRYGFELEWQKLAPLLSGIERLAPVLQGDMQDFIQFIRRLAEGV